MYQTIDRYIIKEIGSLFILVLFILTFVLMMGKFLQLMDMIINKGLRLIDIARLLMYLLPSFLIFTLPISFLTSVLVGLGRLSADNELTALKVAGVGLTRLLVPVGSLALLFFLLTALVGLMLLPLGNQATKSLLFRLAMTKASVGIKEKIFNTDFQGVLIYAETVSPQGDYLEGVIISDRRLTNEPGTFYAKKAYLVSDDRTKRVFLRLEKGSLHMVDARRNSYRRMEFSTYDVQLDIGATAPDPASTPQVSHQEMTVFDLWKKMQSPAGDIKTYREAAIELNKRFTMPVSCLVFGLLGIPLGIRAHRSVKSRGLTISLALVLGYYLIQMSGDALAEKGWIPIWVGTWTPNLFFLVLGIMLFSLAARDISLLERLKSRLMNIRKPMSGRTR